VHTLDAEELLFVLVEQASQERVLLHEPRLPLAPCDMQRIFEGLHTLLEQALTLVHLRDAVTQPLQLLHEHGVGLLRGAGARRQMTQTAQQQAQVCLGPCALHEHQLELLQSRIGVGGAGQTFARRGDPRLVRRIEAHPQVTGVRASLVFGGLAVICVSQRHCRVLWDDVGQAASTIPPATFTPQISAKSLIAAVFPSPDRLPAGP
jgi:hypothetical protein